MAKNVKKRPKESYRAKTPKAKKRQAERLKLRWPERLKKRITLHKASYRMLSKPL